MGVSKNRGTPKSSILIGFSIINHPFWGTTIFGNTHISNYQAIPPKLWAPSSTSNLFLGSDQRTRREEKCSVSWLFIDGFNEWIGFEIVDDGLSCRWNHGSDEVLPFRYSKVIQVENRKVTSLNFLDSMGGNFPGSCWVVILF